MATPVPSFLGKLNSICDACLSFRVTVSLQFLLLKFVEDFLRWCSKNVMNFVDLVQLIVAWKDREETYDLKEDTSYSPVVHLMIIVAICKQTFRWPVPPG